MNDERWKTALGLPLTGETKPLPAGVLDRCMTAINERDKAMSEATAKCTKVRKLVDVKIVCEPPSWIRHYGDHERYIRELERWIAEFQEFVRDHRSQDPVCLSVERVYQEQCTACGREWEEFFDDDKAHWCCAGCGTEMEIVR